MMTYLGVIEDRCNDIVASYASISYQQKNYDMSDNKGMFNASSMAKIKNDAPSFVAEDLSESEGEGEKPLTLEEFKLKAKDKIETKKIKDTGKLKKGGSKYKKK